MLGLAFAMAGPPGGRNGTGRWIGRLSTGYSAGFDVRHFYFLLICRNRSITKRNKLLPDSRSKRETSVITAGGVHGKVTSV